MKVQVGENKWLSNGYKSLLKNQPHQALEERGGLGRKERGTEKKAGLAEEGKNAQKSQVYLRRQD